MLREIRFNQESVIISIMNKVILLAQQQIQQEVQTHTTENKSHRCPMETELSREQKALFSSFAIMRVSLSYSNYWHLGTLDKLHEIAAKVYEKLDILLNGKTYQPGILPQRLQAVFQNQLQLLQRAITESEPFPFPLHATPSALASGGSTCSCGKEGVAKSAKVNTGKL
ncbi:hypothetical protein KIL84_008692 [Mauremys mutica]|uniref:Uncharacterized protein n=1 Tax=Mauremys mutica TaxID=74926 RepID=A0A9D3X872_9SAUR|nr:hypothetical protein KIL84_008692 [Mauremys mutica]